MADKPGSLIDLVGNTPLIEIPHRRSKQVALYAKCEWFNPSGSVKDRAAAALEFSNTVAEGVMVTILPDNALTYLKEPFWNDNTYLIEDPF